MMSNKKLIKYTKHEARSETHAGNYILASCKFD